MTRNLSQALGAEEPYFSQSISTLEKASGMPSADIRLSTLIMQHTRQKLAALGLDPKDTTAEELYNALLLRMERDDHLVKEALHLPEGSTPTDIVSSVATYLTKAKFQKDCFVIKTSVARKMLKQKPPKHAMKLLGYRSVDSMLKREPPALLYAAAMITETPQWQKQFRDLYNKLKPSDFEIRKVDFISPKSKKWQQLADRFLESYRHSIICLKDLGVVVLLPISTQIDGLAITSLLLSLEFINDIRSQSSYAKLQQVKPDFGKLIKNSSLAEPVSSAKIAGQPITWRMIQKYYGQSNPGYSADVFEPHVQEEDLSWNSIENELAKLEPELSFWAGTDYLFVLNEGKPVSLNVLDTSLNYCNHLSFTDRVVKYMRSNLWHELMSKYIDKNNLENALQEQLTDDLVENTAALAESANIV